MKKAIVLIWLLTNTLFSYGQLEVTADETIQLGKFKLGDSLLKYHHDLRLTFETATKVTSYQYLPSLKEPIQIGNNLFRILSLDFDESGRLISLYFTKVYHEDNFMKEARNDYNTLVDLFEVALKKEGQHRVYYPNIHEGYEWEMQNSLLMIDIQETGKRESTSVGINLRRNE